MILIALVSSCKQFVIQDSEVGDGTTSVVLLAGELLKQVKPYVEEGLHPQIIMAGLRTGAKVALAHLRVRPLNESNFCAGNTRENCWSMGARVVASFS